MTTMQLALADGTPVVTVSTALEPPQPGTIIIVDSDAEETTWVRYRVDSIAWNITPSRDGKSHSLSYVIVWVEPLPKRTAT